jgi:hypothetical protein
VVRSGGAAVERARRQWQHRKTKSAHEREGANAMAHWRGDMEATYARVCACMRALWHMWHTARAVAASVVRL